MLFLQLPHEETQPFRLFRRPLSQSLYLYVSWYSPGWRRRDKESAIKMNIGSSMTCNLTKPAFWRKSERASQNVVLLCNYFRSLFWNTFMAFGLCDKRLKRSRKQSVFLASELSRAVSRKIIKSIAMFTGFELLLLRCSSSISSAYQRAKGNSFGRSPAWFRRCEGEIKLFKLSNFHARSNTNKR